MYACSENYQVSENQDFVKLSLIKSIFDSNSNHYLQQNVFLKWLLGIFLCLCAMHVTRFLGEQGEYIPMQMLLLASLLLEITGSQGLFLRVHDVLPSE